MTYYNQYFNAVLHPMLMVLLVCILASLTVTVQAAPESVTSSTPQDETIVKSSTQQEGNISKPSEPSALLPQINKRGAQKDSVFVSSPLGSLHESTSKSKEDLYDATGLKLGFALTHLFQAISNSVPNEKKRGMATTSDMVASWDLMNKGKPTIGKLVTHVQARWDWGSTGPEDLGFTSLAGSIGTADTFSKYVPAAILRNMYWRHGSSEAGWVYQVGKITPDGILASSTHLASETTFLPGGGTGPFAIALPDSGLGASVAWFINDRVTLGALVSDANADRFDFGDISEGDLFKAVELHVKLAPKTEKAGYSKITLWHTDGTKDGNLVNASAGPSGWGYYLKHEQELSTDGRAIGILRYGKSYDDSAFYDEQAGVHFLLYDPGFMSRLNNDVIGVALNWASTPFAGSRDEFNAELFYRFPLYPHVDTTFSYQWVKNPALTRELDQASVFSLRFRTTF
jgi:porin